MSDSETRIEISDLVEKPSVEDAPSDLAVLGRYILSPKIFDKLETTQRGAGGEIQLTDAIRALSAEQPVFGYQFEGVRHDAGTWHAGARHGTNDRLIKDCAFAP